MKMPLCRLQKPKARCCESDGCLSLFLRIWPRVDVPWQGPVSASTWFRALTPLLHVLVHYLQRKGSKSPPFLFCKNSAWSSRHLSLSELLHRNAAPGPHHSVLRRQGCTASHQNQPELLKLHDRTPSYSAPPNTDKIDRGPSARAPARRPPLDIVPSTRQDSTRDLKFYRK